jgi:hypothetical protein
MAAFKWGVGLLLMLAIGPTGCDSSTSTGGGASMDELASAASAQKAAEQQKKDEQAEAERKAKEAQQAAAAGPPPKRAGRPQVGEGGYLTAIVGARRRVLNEADRWPWLQAVTHFKAEHGRLPKDHAEFMNKIVIPMEINLGYKEEDEEFFYDPNEGDWGELYVVEKVEEPAPE